MKQGKKKRQIHLWLLMAAVFTGILSLIIAVIILVIRFSLADHYEERLHSQLSAAQRLLHDNDYSLETARQFGTQGLYVFLQREGEKSVAYQDARGFPFSMGPRRGEGEGDRDPPRSDAELLRDLIEKNLGAEDGSFFTTDIDGQRQSRQLENKSIFLCGRDQGWLYCLYLPVESTNAAITLSIRYVTVISVAAWAVSLILLYFLSRIITRPHRRIADTAAQIAKMDFSQRCPEAVTIELNDMSQSINAMADSLQANVEALRGANEQLHTELAARTRQQQITSELIANLSHDLKTPISIISGYAEGLLEGVARTPEKKQSYYDRILRESERMQVIVSRILDLGRMESGETPIRLEDFDLAELLNEVLDSFDRELERQGLTLDRVGERPCMVHTDYICARQSLLNYVQNAIFHINNGKRIEVRLVDQGDSIRVRVSKSSAPIPEEEARKLWDKLYRGDPSRQRHNGEVGLGLAIVKGNMERLGHPYGFENDPDFPGVAFWLELPKAEK